MWCDFGKSKATIALVCVVTAGAVISNTAFAALQRNYKQAEFRAVLHGLGYNVKLANEPLTDQETKKAISEFQKGYRLSVDGKAGPQTQAYAANIVQILQGNLNTVLKPNPPLPRNQFYSTRIEELVKEYQQKNQLPQTGVADLALRQKLNEEARNVIGKPTTSPTPRTTTSPTPRTTTSPTPRTTTSPTPRTTTSPTPRTTTSPTPRATTSPTPRITTSPTPRATTSPTPRITTSPTPRATTSPTPRITTSPTPRATTSPTPRITTSPTPR